MACRSHKPCLSHHVYFCENKKSRFHPILFLRLFFIFFLHLFMSFFGLFLLNTKFCWVSSCRLTSDLYWNLCFPFLFYYVFLCRSSVRIYQTFFAFLTKLMPNSAPKSYGGFKNDIVFLNSSWNSVRRFKAESVLCYNHRHFSLVSSITRSGAWGCIPI